MKLDTGDNLATTGATAMAVAPSALGGASMDAIDRADEERRWAKAAAEGSVVAFERIARAYQAPLMRFLQRRLGRNADAEDVLQETLVLAYRKIGTFDPRWRLSTWLFAIAVRSAATFHRRKRPSMSPLQGDHHDASPEPLASAADRERTQQVWAVARQTLRPEQFDALWLYYVQQMNVPEVAHSLGRTRLTTKVLLHRARQRLKPHLASMADGGEETISRGVK